MVSLTNRKLIGLLLVGLFLFHLPGTPVVAQDKHGHQNYVNTIDWNSDGSKLASGSTDETVRIWSQTGDYLDVKKSTIGHNGSVLDVAWSPDDRTLVSGSTDQSVLGWNLTEGDIIPTYTFVGAHIGYVKRIAFDPSSDPNFPLVASGGDGTSVKLYRLNQSSPLTYTTIRILTPIISTVTGLDFNQDGSILAIATESGVIRLYNATLLKDRTVGKTEALMMEYKSDLNILNIALNAAGDRIIVASTTGISTYAMINPTNAATLGSTLDFSCEDTCLNIGVEFSPDESSVAIAANTKIGVYPWTSTGFSTTTPTFSLDTVSDLGFQDGILAVDVAWNPDGSTLAIAAGADVIAYNVNTNKLIFRIKGEIPQSSNAIVIAGVVIFFVIIIALIVRRQLRKGKI